MIRLFKGAGLSERQTPEMKSMSVMPFPADHVHLLSVYYIGHDRQQAIEVHIEPDSFDEVVEDMIRVDRERAERAFLTAMLKARQKGAN